MIRVPNRALLATLATAALLASQPRDASSAAEVHRLNLIVSGIPTQVAAKDFNDFITTFNRAALDPIGVEGLETMDFAWLFDARLHYFVRPNVAVSAGAGQLRRQSKREFLPGILQDVQIRAELLSVPVHVGGAYYLQPYTQGDFQARVYLGGGFSSLVYTFGRLASVATGLDSTVANAANFKISGRGDSPGYYVETGVHMFFASRYSVLMGLVYRSAKVRDVDGTIFIRNREVPLGRLFDLDTSGIGARLGLAVGL